MAQASSGNNRRRTNSSGKSGSGNNSRSRSTSSSSRSNSSRKPSTKSTNSSKKAVISAEEEFLSFGDYWHAFTKTRFFKPVMTIVVLVLIVLIDLLISWNYFDRFFTILGIELIIVSLLWVIGLVFNISSDHNNTAPEVNDKE